MITEALLSLLILMLGVVFTFVSEALSLLGLSLADFMSEVRPFLLWIFTNVSYFFDPNILKAAVLYIPAFYFASTTISAVRYLINLIRGAGA